MNRIVATMILLSTAVLPSACDMPGRTRITVEFTQAPQLKGGEVVTLGGQQIGRAEKPRVRAGAVEVDVVLDRNDSLRDETIFLLDTREEAVTLTALPRGKEMVILGGGEPRRFRGASSRMELAMMVTKEELRGFRDWLSSAVGTAVDNILE